MLDYDRHAWSVLLWFAFVLCCFGKDARTGTKDAAKAMVTNSKVSQQEALQILNLQKHEMKPDLIIKVQLIYPATRSPTQ